MERSDFPEVGTRLTYGEAIPAYNRFERSMLERVYGDGLATPIWTIPGGTAPPP